MKINNSYYFDSFFWSTTATLVRSVVNFISIPLLLSYLGIDNYGILTLALSTNAYIAMMDIGGNTGPVKFFSEWFSQKDYSRISKVAGTSITFYLLFGLLNAAILIFMAFFGESWFKLTPAEFQEYRTSLFIIAFFAIFNWCSHVFSQLITALEKISFVRKIEVLVSLLSFVVVLVTIKLSLTLNAYFFLYTLIQSLVIIPYYLCLKSRKNDFILSLWPQTHWRDFGVVLKYSIAIFSMGIFQALAAKSRPIILGVFADNASVVLGEYRIIEVFPAFLISICGALIMIFLPKSSKYVLQNDRIAIEKLAYDGSKITSIFSCLLCYPIMINALEILTVYVGPEYEYLAIWMILWCFTLLLNLYNSPIASLILATGKTRMLVYSSAIACVVSIIINSILCKSLGVGAAVVGYLTYIIIQQMFYFLYFDNKVLGLDSVRVLRVFGLPVLGGLFLSCVVYYFFEIIWDSSICDRGLLVLHGLIKGGTWLGLFVTYLHITRLMTVQEMKSLIVRH